MAYKARSITSKASSACRMNAALVAGHTATGTAKKTGMDHFEEGVKKDMPAPKPNPTTPPESPEGDQEKSPIPLAPLIAAAIPAVVGALSKGKGEKSGGGGGSTKVVVNNSATANSTSNSQASNAIDPK